MPDLSAIIPDVAAKVTAVKAGPGRYTVEGAKGTWTIRCVDRTWFIDQPDGQRSGVWADTLTEAKAFVATLDRKGTK